MEAEKKTYTVAQIAQELGFNKATVSRALSGKGNLSAETRERILAFAREHNYRPNAVAQSLARSRTHNLALMIPGDSSVFDVAFFRDCLHGICQTATENSYDVLVTMDAEHPIEQLLRLIENRKVDGVIAMRSLVGSPVASVLEEKGFPYVLVGSTDNPSAIWIDNDNRSACREMTEVLIRKGIRKMALLGGSEDFCVTHARRDGFLDACSAAGLDLSQQMIRCGVTGQEEIDAAISELMAQEIECIVCMDDCISNMTLVNLRNRNIRVPEDIKLVSFYDNVLLENHIPPITAIRFDAVTLGKMACSEMIRMLETGSGESRLLSGYQITERQST